MADPLRGRPLQLLRQVPRLAWYGRRLLSGPRYLYQLVRARLGQWRYGHRYPSQLLYIAGLPKSGTSWLEGMLAELPGFASVMPSRVIQYEARHGESHTVTIPLKALRACMRGLCVMKLHTRPSSENIAILEAHGVRCVALYRDLRDVAVSHVHYVQRTPWHPEFEAYAPLSLSDGLWRFRRTLLPEFGAWIRGWREIARTRDWCMELRYEDILEDPPGSLLRVFKHYGIECSHTRAELIAERHSFSAKTGGRRTGELHESSFYRQGTAGGWKSHFTARLQSEFQREVGELLNPSDSP